MITSLNLASVISDFTYNTIVKEKTIHYFENFSDNVFFQNGYVIQYCRSYG